jgi:hypothetical protein
LRLLAAEEVGAAVSVTNSPGPWLSGVSLCISFTAGLGFDLDAASFRGGDETMAELRLLTFVAATHSADPSFLTKSSRRK